VPPSVDPVPYPVPVPVSASARVFGTFDDPARTPLKAITKQDIFESFSPFSKFRNFLGRQRPKFGIFCSLEFPNLGTPKWPENSPSDNPTFFVRSKKEVKYRPGLFFLPSNHLFLESQVELRD
jgi:hypothetical protein